MSAVKNEPGNRYLVAIMQSLDTACLFASLNFPPFYNLKSPTSKKKKKILTVPYFLLSPKSVNYTYSVQMQVTLVCCGEVSTNHGLLGLPSARLAFKYTYVKDRSQWAKENDGETR
jgi:hypothetical protein